MSWISMNGNSIPINASSGITDISSLTFSDGSTQSSGFTGFSDASLNLSFTSPEPSPVPNFSLSQLGFSQVTPCSALNGLPIANTNTNIFTSQQQFYGSETGVVSFDVASISNIYNGYTGATINFECDILITKAGSPTVFWRNKVTGIVTYIVGGSPVLNVHYDSSDNPIYSSDNTFQPLTVSFSVESGNTAFNFGVGNNTELDEEVVYFCVVKLQYLGSLGLS
jgi:hypothetical protein